MLTIRPATIADVPLLRRFIQELADYEGESQSVLTTEADLTRDGFGPDPKFRAIIAEQHGAEQDGAEQDGAEQDDRQPAGFAVFFISYSTWAGSGIFLEDLFVRESFRGRGAGKALLAQLAEIALNEGHRAIRLDVLDWNESAIHFYKSLGAEYLPQWRNVIIGEEALGRLSRAKRASSAGSS
jgi:ribosomal protein S18 acetylase RimI-like enzyme